MIVKDEEEFLPRCLQSVKEVVDEIILVDTGSSDATLEIAHSFKAKIFQYEWKDDFSDARNFSLKYATSDWILFLDADEVLDENSAKKMSKILQRTKHFGFFFCIYSVKANGFVSGRHYTVRLFRNQKGVRFVGEIHEQILPMGNLAYSGMSIYHFGYDLEMEKMKRKKERNAHILKKIIAKSGEDPILRYHLANTHLLLGEYEKAIEHTTKGMELTKEFKEKNYLYLATLQVLIETYCQMRQWDKAEERCLEALSIRDDFIDALYSLARIYMVKNEYRKALLVYHRFLEKKRLIDCEPERGFFFRCLNSWGRESEIHNDLGGIFYESGNIERAIKEVQKAIALQPHDARAYYNLGSALAKKGQFEEARRSFKKALEIKPTYTKAEEGLKRLENVL